MAQTGIAGNCDYPDSMDMNKQYAFDISNDTLIQTVEVTAIGKKQLRYSIETRIRDTEILAGELIEHYSGIAEWAGCFGPVTEGSIIRVDNWDYRSNDGLLVISLYGSKPERLRLEIANIIGGVMNRK
jgi:hypothetical protein